MTGRVHRAADRRFFPWKNGGGDAAEIVCHPVGAGFHDFDWRISTARVAASGPFSTFEGVDRVLTVLDGGAMTLHLPAGDTTLAPNDPPFSFAGDVTCGADLHGAPLLDLNVMVRRPHRALVTRDTADLSSLRASDTSVCATYRLALAPVTDLGLKRYDLQDLSAAFPDVIPRDILVIVVYRQDNPHADQVISRHGAARGAVVQATKQ